MRGQGGAEPPVEGFQSAPGLEAGRCGMHRVVVCYWASFNPRPALRPGDAYHDHHMTTNVALFQSAPGLEAGRCTSSPLDMAWTRSFNPRPALRPGDADHVTTPPC